MRGKEDRRNTQSKNNFLHEEARKTEDHFKSTKIKLVCCIRLQENHRIMTISIRIRTGRGWKNELWQHMIAIKVQVDRSSNIHYQAKTDTAISTFHL